MARKSNKTSHVLHLLAGEEPIEETAEAKEETVEIQEAVTEQEPESDTPNISIVSTRNSEDDPLADLIKQQLEEDFPEEILNTASADGGETEPVFTSAPPEADNSDNHTADAASLAKDDDKEDSEQWEAAPTAESAQTEPKDSSDAEPIQTQAEAHSDTEPVQNQTETHSDTEPVQNQAETHSDTEPVQNQAETHSDAAPVQNQAETHSDAAPVQNQAQEEPKEHPHTNDTQSPLSSPEAEKTSPSLPDSGAAQPSSAADASSSTHYRFVNVMEYIIKDSVLEQMKKFDMCTCERCQVDTIALALTNCPAKYIVVDNHTVSPLLNYYSNKFMGTVTVELIKACTMVKENPRH